MCPPRSKSGYARDSAGLDLHGHGGGVRHEIRRPYKRVVGGVVYFLALRFMIAASSTNSYTYCCMVELSSLRKGRATDIAASRGCRHLPLPPWGPLYEAADILHLLQIVSVMDWEALVCSRSRPPSVLSLINESVFMTTISIA